MLHLSYINTLWKAVPDVCFYIKHHIEAKSTGSVSKTRVFFQNSRWRMAAMLKISNFQNGSISVIKLCKLTEFDL